MKPSLWLLLGLLVVALGTANATYPMRRWFGGGEVFYAQDGSTCDKDWPTLRLRASCPAVSFITDPTAPKRLFEGTTYHKTDQIAMFYNETPNELNIFAKEVPDFRFHKVLTASKGQYVLNTADNLDMLKFLSGFTICVENIARDAVTVSFITLRTVKEA
eukprot:GHVS01068804.1.p1 GENE.GHVS01068804.1~~GHVS01068804.1.p1  ORF type:complete len:160 (-),score=12.47 GHVS01068804.1:752-1231(-)